ncbi:MAG: VOC family protein [Candidatus Diapherotrites archaeon]
MNNNSAKDPAGHLKLSVSDLERSKAFYSRLFELLKFIQIANKEKSAGWVTTEGFGIWITQAEFMTHQHVFKATGFHHLCLKANSEKEVDAIYEGIKNEARIFAPPAKHPKYTEKYYAFTFADLDGMKLEVAYY